MILEVYNVFESLCIREDFDDEEWDDLFSEDFKYYARNWDLDYKEFAIENPHFSNNEYMTKKEFLEEKKKMYVDGLWQTKDFILDLKNYTYNEFNTTYYSDEVVVQISNNIKYYMKFCVDLNVKIDEFGLINYTKAFHKPNTIKTESV